MIKKILLLPLFAILIVLPVITFAATTTDRVVRLRFDAPSYIDQVRLSNFANMDHATLQAYTGGTIVWDICGNRNHCTAGSYEVFVEFLHNGEVVKSLSDRVSYQPLPPVVPPPPIPEPVEEPVPEPVIEEPIPEPVVEEPAVIPAPVVEEPASEFAFTINPVVSDVGHAVAAVGVVGAVATSAVSIFGSAMTWSELLIMLPMRLWNLFLIFLGIRKRSKPWGIVYDSQSKQPLDPAYVTLTDMNGNEIATSITDIGGRYGFLVAPGRYMIRAGKTHYTFPSQRLVGKANDSLYQDLYFGEEVLVGDDQVITKNIPMDSEFADWNQEEKKRMKVGYVSGVHILVATISNLVMYTGMITSLIFTIISPSPLNIIFLIIYAVIIVARLAGFKPRSYGFLTRKGTGEGLGNAIVRIISAKLGHEIGHAVADPRGHYYVLVPRGEYTVGIEEKKGEEMYEKIYTTPTPVVTKKGIVNKSFEV